MPSAAARRAYDGPALFSYGFRPFFFGASCWAATVVPVWLWVHLAAAGSGSAIDRDWHVHEMLFGYLGGVVAGFLLTSIPNWTGRLPVAGRPLALLYALWVIGRVAMLFIDVLGVGAIMIDAAFLVVFAAVVWREVVSGRNWRNLPVCGLVSALALANLAFHGRAIWPALGGWAERGGLAAIAVMIALIGGRITPSFTRNWLAQRGQTALPAPADRLDQIALLLCVAAAIAWAVAPWASVSGGLACLAGAGVLARLSRWRTALTLGEPLVWSLHAGYFWLGLAFLLIGLGMMDPAAWPPTAGAHALTAGAAGVMTLAVMTRATLGHTGRARTADRSTLVIYLAINLAAVVRVAAPFAPELRTLLLGLAGAFWSLAFLLFVACYGPMLIRARLPAAA